MIVIIRITLNLTIKKDVMSCARCLTVALILDMFSPLTSFESGQNKEILSGEHNKFGKDDEQLSTNNDSRY